MAAGRIVLPPYFPARDRNARLVSGAKLYVWDNETTDKASIYADAALSSPLANPVTANGSGHFPSIWADAGTEEAPVLYSLAVTDASGGSIGNPAVFDNYRPSVDWETAASALSESSAASAEQAAANIQDAYEAVLAMAADPGSAGAVATRLNLTASNVGDAAALRENIGADLAENINFAAAGTYAAPRTSLAKMRDVISVFDFQGVEGDPDHDDALGLRRAIAQAAGRSLYLPDPPGGYYRCDSSLGTLPDSTRLYGESKRTTRLRANFNGGSLLNMADGSALEKLYIDGNSKTCQGLTFLGGAGNQHVNDVRAINFANDCLYFEKNAGSGFNSVNLEAYRSDGASGSGNYAIVIEDAAGGLGPKHFFGYESGGMCAFSFGGANNVYVIGSTLADCEFSDNTSSVHIIGGRIANASTMTILGQGISIVGGDVFPEIILGTDAQSCIISPAAANNGITDNSGKADNLVFDGVTKSYTPTLSTSGGTVDIGNGTLSGSWQRTGTLITGNIDFIKGSATVFNGGGGFLRFGLPLTPISISLQRNVTCMMQDGSTFYFGSGYIQSGVAYITLIRDTSGLISTGSPFTIGTDDSVRISFSYNL